MKICKLKLKNLNSFREKQEIDFESGLLSDASLVAITGPTGAGKTTLLDAICVALYGKTPRLSGTKKQHPRHLISHGETEGFAEVYFEVNNTPYHATWSIKRKGSPKAQLFDNFGKLITTKVAQEVESILGLNFDAFRRSVMLAQGEFAAFLKAKNDERRTILEATAGVSIYDVLKQTLNDKVNEVEAANAEVYDKLNRIPETSHEQLSDAEAELERLQTGADTLGTKSQQIHREKDRETKRKEDFEKLQSSEKRQEELLAQQPEIEALQAELENATRAQHLLPEKREFDTAKLEIENATGALSSAKTEKTEAADQVEIAQIVYNEKETAFDAASAKCDAKIPVYTAAKSDVERAAERFAEADKRTPELVNVNSQINALENQRTDRQMQQTELQRQVEGAQRFLDDNPLPSDRQARLNRTSSLLAERTSHGRQLGTELKNKASAEKRVSSLRKEIEKLSKTQEEHFSEKAAAETSLADATTQLNKLLSTGTHAEWTTRRQRTSKAQPIAQKYEATQEDLADTENQLNDLNETAAELTTELEQIKTDLASQTEVGQKAAKIVQRCEAERESMLLANPINQLRQHLHTGKPCLVCGSIEHPYAHVVESESEERIQRAEEALADAKDAAAETEAVLQTLRTKQIQTEQNKSNTTDQIEARTAEMATLQDAAAELLTEWQAIYADIDVSSKWVSEQFDFADAAIAGITKADQTRTQADGALQIVSQQLETCENDIKRETKALRETEAQLEGLNDTIADLQADIKATEERFWESMPEIFHGVTPREAVDQFEDKIEMVASRETQLRKAETDLQVLNANIKADQDTLQNLKDSRETLKNEKDEYLREQEMFLDAAREKTGGLETEAEIDKAIEALKADLQAKENERNSAEQQLQNSQDLLTQKRTTYDIAEKQFNTAAEKLNAVREVYFNKLEKEGFEVPEAHDNAFRDDDQLQGLTERINAYQEEVRDLASDIRELSARFDENPFEPEALGRIEIELSETEVLLQEKQQEIGAQQQKIYDLKDALEKREALDDELGAAQQELERWQRLQQTIPANALRDFALEIMFRQMGNLANTQLRYLTSDRYALKVENIGDLTVIDRWNANEERPVETLSGGESFLTSLALALALSELSRGRSQLNSLFLDEGFGTLDVETLDIAIAALEGLRMQGRNIFLISHIRELTRRLPVKIEVNKKGNGSSSVDVRG